MQFLLLTPLLVFVLWKYGRVGIGILTIVIIGSILAPGILTFDGDMLPTVIPTRECVTDTESFSFCRGS